MANTSFAPTLPNFSSLGSGISLGSPSMGISQSTPATLSGSGSIFSTPAVPKIAPSTSNSQSSDTALNANLPNGGLPLPPKPIIPMTTPAAYSKTNPSSPYITTPSGATVDAHTGALITPPPTPNISSAYSSGGTPASTSTGSLTDASLGTTPAIPSTITGASTTGVGSYTPGDPDSLDPSTNPLTSDPAYQAALASVQQYSTMSPEEQQLQDQITNLNSSENSSYINAEGHGGDLPFVTGEQKNIAELGSVEGTRLAGLLTNAQAQRQLNLQGATTQLTAAQNQLQALQTRNAPVTVPFGGTVVSKGGTTIGGGAFGNAGTSGSTSGTGEMPATGSPFDPTNTVDQIVQEYMQNPDAISSRYSSNPSYMAPIIARANDISEQQTGQPFNAATVSANNTANSAALTNLTTQTNASQTALSTVQQNGQLLLQGLQTSGLNTSQIPMINSLTQAVDALGADPGDVATFKNSLTTLQSEYSKLLAGQGSTTEGGASRAGEALPSNISISDMAKVLDRIVSEGQNTITSQASQIAKIKSSISPYDFSGKTTSSSKTNLGTSGGSSSSSGWASLAD